MFLVPEILQKLTQHTVQTDLEVESFIYCLSILLERSTVDVVDVNNDETKDCALTQIVALAIKIMMLKLTQPNLTYLKLT